MARGSTAEREPIERCPYLRTGDAPVADEPGGLGRDATDGAPPVPAATACTAGHDQFRPGPRQQALMCTTGRHIACPRFPAADRGSRHGAAAPRREPAPWAQVGPLEPGQVAASPPAARRAIGRAPLPTIVASAILVVALVAAFAFTALRGSIDLAAPGDTATPAASIAASSPGSPPAVSPAATTAPASAASTAAVSSAAPTVTPPVSPAPTATVAPASSPVPTPRATPADPRFVGLQACPDRPDCYLYVVQRGDTLSSIAASFGVSLRDIRDLNADIANPSIIRVGQRIRVPGPG